MATLTQYLEKAVEAKAADLFLVAGGPASIKGKRGIVRLDDQRLLPADTEALVREIYGLSGRSIARYLETGDDDFSFVVPNLSRFRVNTYRQRGSMAAVIRIIAFKIPDYREHNIPDAVMELSELNHGMVLFSGTAGCGKSTTQTCIVDRINHSRSAHIITLEDPIEHLHRNDRCIISQREISIDTGGYAAALRACLRQAPDVILLGEMRDAETIHTAITAAETGHLLLGTLHTQGAVNSVDRIIDSFPAEQQAQVRTQLSMTLEAAVSQQLLPDVDGGKVPAFEILRVNSGIRNMIREARTYQIDNVIQTSASEGMISMDTYITQLYRSGRITAETAVMHAVNPEQMYRRVQTK